MHVFLVDDEKDIVAITSAMLKRNGHIVTSCGTVKEAIAVIKQNAFDAYLLDVHLPDGSGFELLEAIEDNKTAPIIIMSAYDDVAHEWSKYPMVTEFLKKPFQLNQVLKAITTQ